MRGGVSVLDPLLGRGTVIERVLYGSHLGDGVGCVYEFGGCVTARDDHREAGGFISRRSRTSLHRDIPLCHRIVQFIQDQEVIAIGGRQVA